jgi:hypothetical protein
VPPPLFFSPVWIVRSRKRIRSSPPLTHMPSKKKQKDKKIKHVF